MKRQMIQPHLTKTLKPPRRRHNLSIRLQQYEALASFGEYALRSQSLGELFDHAVHLIARTQRVELCKILELLPSGEDLLLRAGVGWKPGLLGQALVTTEADSQAGFTLINREPVVVHNLRSETRFRGSTLLTDHNVISGISVIIPGPVHPFGILAIHSTRERAFTVQDERFMKSMANVLASAIERTRTEDELRRSRNEIEIILDSVFEGITAQTRSGKIVYANQSAAELIGFPSPQELIRAPIAEVMNQFEMFDSEGNPFPFERLPGRLVMQGTPQSTVRIRFRIVATGEERWSIVSARPVLDPKGNPILAVNVFRDITEIIHAEETQKLLAEAGKYLSGSLDEQATLSNLANLVVRRLAEWCTVHLAAQDKGIVQVAVTHKDPSKVQLALDLQRDYPTEWNDRSSIYRVIQSGQPEFMPEITDSMLEASARSEDHLRRLKQLDLRSAMVVPLIADGHTLGAITLVWSESQKEFSTWQVETVTELARRAGTAIDHARLYKKAQALNTELEERVARRTQQLEKSHARLIQEVEERKKAENALRESEALLNSLFEYAPDATLLLDQPGKILQVNRQTEALFGYSRKQLVGMTVDQLLPQRFQSHHPGLRSGFLNHMSTRPMGIGLDLFAMRNDGTEFPVDVMLSPVRVDSGEMVICAVRDMTIQKRLQAELAEIHRRLFESVEGERLLLSQEIHDGPMQDLYGVIFNLESLKAALPSMEEGQVFNSTLEGIHTVLQTLREVCSDLRPPTLTYFGLEKAIRSHLAKVIEHHPELDIELNLEDDGLRLPERPRIALYRIYQNAMSNILRHSQAKHVMIDFSIQNDQLVLKVKDDGRGFMVPSKWVELARAGHFGLVGMAERVQSLGGTLSVDSAPGSGTLVQVELPLKESYEM